MESEKRKKILRLVDMGCIFAITLVLFWAVADLMVEMEDGKYVWDTTEEEGNMWRVLFLTVSAIMTLVYVVLLIVSVIDIWKLTKEE